MPRPLLPPASLVLLLALGAPAAAEGTLEVVLMPAFDHKGMPGSYVLSRPSTWKRKQALPLIIDLHGAIAPSKQGGLVTSRAVWREFVERVPCLVAAPNARMRGWNRVPGDKDDTAYVLAVLADVRKKHKVDSKRIYLAGFSSGSDFACTGGLQRKAPFAGTLVVCPGPPNVVGIRGGELAEVKRHPFVFATGEEDYIRKAGAFEAYEHLRNLGGEVRYREVPRKGHVFLGLDEYVRLFEELERLAHEPPKPDWLALAEAALARDDFLAAQAYATRARKKRRKPADALLKELEAARAARVEAAQGIDAADAPGRAYEAWWLVRTQFSYDKRAVAMADAQLAALRTATSNRDLLRARRAWFASRGR